MKTVFDEVFEPGRVRVTEYREGVDLCDNGDIVPSVSIEYRESGAGVTSSVLIPLWVWDAIATKSEPNTPGVA